MTYSTNNLNPPRNHYESFTRCNKTQSAGHKSCLQKDMGGGTLTLPEATICMFIGPLKKKWSNSVVRTMAMDSDKFLAIESM